MKRIVLALALLAGLAGCGPDCDRFCKHWVSDCGFGTGALTPDVALRNCIGGCNEVGGDYSAFISCAIDKSCPDLQRGHCQIPSVPPGFIQ